MMLVLEIVTLFIKPLLTLLFVLANRRSSARQVLTSVIEIQDLLINMGTKKIPIGFRAVAIPTKCGRGYSDFTWSISRVMRLKNVSFPYSGAAPT